MSRTFFNTLALIPLFIGCGCLAPIDLSAQSQPDKEYIIGSGDLLEIQVWDNEDLHRKVEISILHLAP
jgi:protein involved in polysaccharide export with SLBB domain